MFESIIAKSDCFLEQIEILVKFPNPEIQGIHETYNCMKEITKPHHRAYRNARILSCTEALFENVKWTELLINYFKHLNGTVKRLKMESWVMKRTNYAKVLNTMTNLENIDAYSCSVVSTRYSSPVNLPKLRELAPVNLPKLRELAIVCSDASLLQKVFVTCSNLTLLEVEINQKWTPASLLLLEAFISQQETAFRSLKIVNYSHRKFMKSKNQKTKFQLNSLVLDGVKFFCSGDVEQFIKSQYNLKSVELSINEMTDEIMYRTIIRHILQNNNRLESLTIKKNQFDVEGVMFLDEIKSCDNLKNLHFVEHKFNSSQPDFFPSLINIAANLKTLEIICAGDYEQDLIYCEAISTLKHLTKLILCNIHHLALADIVIDSGTLKTFEIKSIPGDGQLSFLPVFLKQHPTITNLSIGYTSEVTAKLCKIISKSLPSLSVLSVHQFQNSEDCLVAFAAHRYLKKLIMDQHQFHKMSAVIKLVLSESEFEVDFLSLKLPRR